MNRIFKRLCKRSGTISIEDKTMLKGMTIEESNDVIYATEIWDFNDIPINPGSSNIWMIEHTIALWFTTHDNKWRFILMNFGDHTRRSGECFDTIFEARDFYQSGKCPTWVKSSLTEDE